MAERPRGVRLMCPRHALEPLWTVPRARLIKPCRFHMVPWHIPLRLTCIDMAIKRQHSLGSPPPSTEPTKTHYLGFVRYVAYILLGIFSLTIGAGLLVGGTNRQTVGKQEASGTGSHSANPLINSTWVALVEDESPTPNWYGQVTVWILHEDPLVGAASDDGIELMPFLTS